MNLKLPQVVENLGASLARCQDPRKPAKGAETRSANNVGIEVGADTEINADPCSSLEGSKYDDFETASSYAESWVSLFVTPAT